VINNTTEVAEKCFKYCARVFTRLLVIFVCNVNV